MVAYLNRISLHISGGHIGCKTLFSERGKLPVKLTCPVTLVNKGDIGLCPKHYLPSGASQGFVQLAQCPFLSNSLAMGPVVMLHVAYVYYKIVVVFSGIWGKVAFLRW